MAWHFSLPKVCSCSVYWARTVFRLLCWWGNSGIALTTFRQRSRNKAAGLQLLNELPQVRGCSAPVFGHCHGLLDGHEAPLHHPKLGVVLGEGEQRLPHTGCCIQTFAEEELNGSL